MLHAGTHLLKFCGLSLSLGDLLCNVFGFVMKRTFPGGSLAYNRPSERGLASPRRIDDHV